MMITLLSLSFFRTVRLLCIVWVIALAPLLAAPRDLTFIVVSDTHYGLNPVGDETVPLLVDKMNAIAGTSLGR